MIRGKTSPVGSHAMVHRSSVASDYIGQCIELLEPRSLRSAVLLGTELHVVGTHKNDNIRIALDPSVHTVIRVQINNNISVFNVASITNIFVNGGAGKDRITVEQTNGIITFSNNRYYGGTGNDAIIAGAGRDRIDGGPG